ncbi:MAG: CvpA family protein [Desulfomonile tiedjei]|nr:CvpA family protein [Desulfomonile tiedjei]
MQFVESYNLIDMFIVGTVFITLVLGVWKGFVRSLTALASLVLGVLLAVWYHPAVAPYLSRVSSLDPQIATILSMVVIFILVQALFVVIRRILDELLDVARLTWVDRILGAAMGAIAGFMVVASAVQVILIGIPEWPLVKSSKLVVPVDKLSEKALTHAPQQARDYWQSIVTNWKGTPEQPPQKGIRQSDPSKRAAVSPPPGPAK